jgi:hypothetical protein
MRSMKRVLIAVLAATTAIAGTAHAQTPSPPVGRQTLTPNASAQPTNQSAEEIIVKQQVRAAGLKDVKNLVRNPDGTWRGKAMRDNAEVAVSVDTAGNVTFQ